MRKNKLLITLFLFLFSFSLISCLPRMVNIEDVDLDGCWYGGFKKKTDDKYDLSSKLSFKKTEKNTYVVSEEGFKAVQFTLVFSQKIVKFQFGKDEITFDLVFEKENLLSLKNPSSSSIPAGNLPIDVKFIRCDYFDTWKKETGH